MALQEGTCDNTQQAILFSLQKVTDASFKALDSNAELSAWSNHQSVSACRKVKTAIS